MPKRIVECRLLKLTYAKPSHLLIDDGEGYFRLLHRHHPVLLADWAVGLVRNFVLVCEVRRDTRLLQVEGQCSDWVENLVVQHLHDSLKGHPGDILAVHGLHHPARLNAGHEGLTLGVAWVARLRRHFHHHCAVPGAARGIASDAKGALLVDHLGGGSRGSCRVHEGRVYILGPVTQQVVSPHLSSYQPTTKTSCQGCAHKEAGAKMASKGNKRQGGHQPR
mmetsp:Transcript_67676/g.147400  ORF Transcript_67676/g.147400 Transcript_67676/m.147400 type:complete len:221 (-) Transcript_67676:74-736(-)